METILTTLLEDAWDEVQNMCDTWVYEELGAEFDRLTAELTEASTIANNNYEVILKCNRQINDLQRELARYRNGEEG